MTEYEATVLDAMQELNTLKIEVRNAEKFIDFANETIVSLQDKLFDIEEKFSKGS